MRIMTKFIIRVYMMVRFRVHFWVNDVVRFRFIHKVWIRVWVKVMHRVVVCTMVGLRIKMDINFIGKINI